MLKPLARRLQRLDRFLSSLDAGDDTMLLSKLDGIIAGVAVCPDLIMGHCNQVLRSLARPAKYQPILDQDIDGSLRWELWASGFRKAVRLRPGAWTAFAVADDEDVRWALFSLIRIAEIADGEGNASSDLDELLQDRAPDLVGASLETLHKARLALQRPPRIQSGQDKDSWPR